jgi:hypothetical protein
MPTYTSNWEVIGSKIDPDIVYYNATIINNTTDDLGAVGQGYDPQIRFNETRDTAIIRDVSQFQFSIVRFVVNGANKDLPLFIPTIQAGTGQTDVNLTAYGMALTLQYKSASGNVYTITPELSYVEYIPETQNKVIAPVPRSMANSAYVGVWNSTDAYKIGDVVYYTPSQSYYQAKGFSTAIIPPPAGVAPVDTRYWTTFGDFQGNPQDLSSRYYWVYTYTHWIDLINKTFDEANGVLFTTFQTAWNATADGAFPYADYNAFQADFPAPQMVYVPSTTTFQIYFATTAWGTPLGAVSAQKGFCRLFFNSNMYGLFSNYDNLYWNSTTIPFPTDPYTSFTALTDKAVPVGYTTEILVSNTFYQNLVDFSKLPVPPPAPLSSKVFWVISQDYESTSTLWSPVESLVFCSNLLPIQNEAISPPVVFGQGNLGTGSTSKSAFQPIITDIALDLSTGSADYRKMIYYSPSAEYRMADFQNSHQDLRNIDIQVFWKNRLDSNLYPVNMFNLSSVSIKVLFRKKIGQRQSEGKGDRQ